MAGMFYIMSMYFYLKARTAKERGKSLVFLMLCFVSFLMAFGSKENAAMIPLSLLLYEIILMETDPSKFLRSHIGVFFMILGAGLVASSSYLFFKNESLSSFLRGYGERPFTLTQRLLTEPRIIIFYITLLLYPIPNRFSVAHSIQISSNLFNPPWTFFASLTVVGAIVYLIYGARKHPLFSFCYLFFFLNHVIESSIFPLELIFEHRNYVPSMLFFLPIAVGILRLLNRYGEKRAMRYVISSSLVLILIGLGHSTGMRNLVWKNEERLWSDALEKATDQVRVHHNLGVYYQDRGDRAQAISEFQKALQSPVVHEKDEKIITYYHLGKIYNEAGDYERAKSFYLEALRIRPDFSYALGGLVSIYDKEGQGGLADRYLKKALDSNPADPYINFNMGLYSLKRGMPDKAIGYFMISMKEDGLRARALLYMGIAHKQGGRLGEAVLCLRKSASMDSHNITPHLQLAESLLKSGNEKMGREEVKTALRMMGHQKDLFYQTVDLISKRGHFEEVQLSAELILPIMNEVLQKDSIGPKRWATYLNKTLQRRMALQ